MDSLKKGQGTGRARDRTTARRFAVAGLVAALAAGAGIAYLVRPVSTTGGDAPETAASGARGLVSAAGLPPLPRGRFARPREAVEEAYAFAAQYSEVLRYVPCFCGCERRGHRSKLDCFVASRAANGEVAWSAHGMG